MSTHFGLGFACAQVDWSELFGDLIIVAVALKISSSVKEELSWATIGVTFVSYALYWEAWLYVAAYMSRFASQDLFFKIWHVRLRLAAARHLLL